MDILDFMKIEFAKLVLGARCSQHVATCCRQLAGRAYMALVLLLASVPLCLCGQTNYFGVYSDSNYNILPGYTIPVAQVTGATNALTNYVTIAQFNSSTNGGVVTVSNLNGVAQSVTNLGLALFPAYPTLSSGSNCLTIGGQQTSIGTTIPVMDNAVVLAGKSNLITGYAVAPAIIGGAFNDLEYSSYAGMIGGLDNVMQSPAGFMAGGEYGLIYAGNYDAIVAGISNIIADGSSGFIAGGRFNTIGQEYGYRGVYDGAYQADYCFAAGSGAWPIYSGSFVWSDYEGQTNYIRNTATNQFIVRATGGVGINTNNPGTNALLVNGSVDIEPGILTLGGTNIVTLFSPTITSNGLSSTWNYNLITTSNGLMGFVLGVSNNVNTAASVALAVSNTVTAAQVATSNAVAAQIITTSNSFASALAPQKAFTATLPATYASIGIAFNTPLMPDYNYSVSLTPQDANTAGAAHNGMPWYVGAKSASGFTIYVPFATNAYNLNFDCLVHENTQ